MRISRAPEHRGGGGSSPVLLLLVLVAVLAVGGVVAYLLLTQNQNAPGANPAAVAPPPAQNPAAGVNVGVNSPPQPVAPQVAAPTAALPAIPAAPNNAAMAQAWVSANRSRPRYPLAKPWTPVLWTCAC